MRQHLFFILAVLLPISAAGGDYYKSGSILYERIQTPYTYYYCGRPYTSYKYSYRQVVDYQKDSDWRDKVLKIVERQKEYDEFSKTLEMLGARNILSNGQQYTQQVYSQNTVSAPQAIGTTIGGFSALKYTQYGAGLENLLDINKTSQLAQEGADQYTRMLSSVLELSKNVADNGAELQALNMDRVGAIAEIREQRATIDKLGQVIRDQNIATINALLATRPQPSQQVEIKQQDGTTIISKEGSHPQEQPQQQPSQPTSLLTDDEARLLVKYCVSCHNDESGFNFNDQLTTGELVGLSLRLSDAAPEKKDGKPFKMPPPTATQPTPSERDAIIEAAKKLSAQPS